MRVVGATSPPNYHQPKHQLTPQPMRQLPREGATSKLGQLAALFNNIETHALIKEITRPHSMKQIETDFNQIEQESTDLRFWIFSPI